MRHQRTLKNVVSVTGVGVHSGKPVQLTLRPAESDTGYVFRRVDLPHTGDIPGLSAYVTDTSLSTTLSKEGASVSTVEHLLAALSGLGVDNVYIELDQAEMPIMDGSAYSFVKLIEETGLLKQTSLKQYIRVKKTVSVEQNDKSACLLPHDGFKITFHIDFQHPAFSTVPTQTTLDITPEIFIAEISRARTFGFLKDAEKLRAMNLALGASMENTVVLDDTKVLNPEGLRYYDEFSKHKILDAIGDLALLGKPLWGHFVGVKSGHTLNNLLVKALLADPEAFELVNRDVLMQTEVLAV